MMALLTAVLGLLMMRIDLETKQKVGLLLTFAFLALGALAQQVTAYILP